VNTDNVIKFIPSKGRGESSKRSSRKKSPFSTGSEDSRVVKFRKKAATYPTLEQLMRNEAPTPDLEELLLMLRPGKRAVAQLARYRADRDAVSLN